jgi:GT2 family glycosyltransferase
VSDGSTDGTDRYLRECPPFDLVFASQPNAGPAAARNHALELARGRLVLFVDDDVIAAPDLIQQHVETHGQGEQPLVVIGPMLTPADAQMPPWVRWEQTMLYRQYRAMLDGQYEPTPRQFYTGNASVERAALVRAGGFDTRFRRAEDIELAYRLKAGGARFVFNPDAIGYHHADRPFVSWLRNAHDYGVSDVVFSRDHRQASVGEIVRWGFRSRPKPVQWLTLSCVASSLAASVVDAGFKTLFACSQRVGSERLEHLALSGLYNTAYYRGVADELGGPRRFHEVVAAAGGGWS